MNSTPIPRFGLILIGDELLNGRKQDAHLAAMITRFEERGLELSWVRTIADEGELITQTLAQTFASPDVVFSFGGIGATPDDLTRQCAAAALGLDLALHREAEAEIRSRLGSRLNSLHLRMGSFRSAAELFLIRSTAFPVSPSIAIILCPAFPEWPGRWWSGCWIMITSTIRRPIAP